MIDDNELIELIELELETLMEIYKFPEDEPKIDDFITREEMEL